MNNYKQLVEQSLCSPSWGTVDKKKLDIIKQYAGSSILDVGCAKGFYVEELRKIGFNAYGCDVIKFKDWKNINKALFKIADIYQLPYESNSFDTSLAFEVFEHLAFPQKAFNELVRITKKNIIISVPNCDTPRSFISSGLIYHHYFDRTHVNFYNLEKVLNFVRKNNLKVQYISLINPVMPITLLLESFYVNLSIAEIIGKIIQRIPMGRKYYTDILVVISK